MDESSPAFQGLVAHRGRPAGLRMTEDGTMSSSGIPGVADQAASTAVKYSVLVGYCRRVILVVRGTFFAGGTLKKKIKGKKEG